MHELETAKRPAVLRLMIVTVLVAIPGIAALRPPGPGAWWPTPDLWWHLRAADWIVEHGRFPMTDPFSAFGNGQPWAAYSWLFELLIYALYDAWGLMGVMGYTVVASLAVGVALYLLVRSLLPHFVGSVVITAAGLAALIPVVSPRPWLLTILLFLLELYVLTTVLRTRNWRLLWLLPPLFALWANIHIQFVYGLGLLGLAIVAPALERLARHVDLEVETSSIPLSRLLPVLGVCVLATLASPYHIHLYRVILELITQSGVFQSINELVAMQFRDPADWVVLGLTLAAAFALGRRRPVQVLPMLILVAGAALAFRARRDAWFLVGGACTILAVTAARWLPADTLRFTTFRASVVGTAAALLMVMVAVARGLSEEQLTSIAASRFPIEAANVVDERQFQGPLYNHFNWGGYLMWRLPQYPVSMDGRTNVHLPERVAQSLSTWSGAPEWQDDPELDDAALVIASVNVPLTTLLRSDARFRVVYEDSVAVVFVAVSARRGLETASEAVHRRR